MEKTFQQILASAEKTFESSPESGGGPYQAMENAAIEELYELSDLQLGQLLATRPNALAHTLREQGPVNRKFTLRDIVLRSLVIELVLCMDISIVGPEVYRKSYCGAPEYLDEKIRKYLTGPTFVTVTANGSSSPQYLGA
jgi:hypothetical protein